MEISVYLQIHSMYTTFYLFYSIVQEGNFSLYNQRIFILLLLSYMIIISIVLSFSVNMYFRKVVMVTSRCKSNPLKKFVWVCVVVVVDK